MTSRKMDLRLVVGEEVFQRAGLAKLDRKERAVLAGWIEDRVARAVNQTEKNRAKHGPDGPPPWPTSG